MTTAKYQLHYDSENKQYWIGRVVANSFVQQVGNYYETRGRAIVQLQRLNNNN